MNESLAVKVTNLTVHYNARPILWDINLDILTGQLVGILGPNGAGKSSLLKTILGLINPVSGSIRILDKKLNEVRRRLAYVPQRESIDWDFPITVKQLVLMGRYPHLGPFGWIKKSDIEAVEHVLQKLGLYDLKDRQIGQLSGGQQQRAFLARAILQDPDIYFLDEPLAGVDHATEEIIMNELQRAVQNQKTVLMVHHDLHSVEKYFTWLVLLHVRLIAQGPTKSVFTKETIRKAYGKNFALFDETVKLSQNIHSGM